LIISVHQPAYIPWLGYFDKIIRSDTFVYLDTVQYEKNSFINRNRIKTPQGVTWLTVPVKTKGHLNATLLETEIDKCQNWREKHLRSIYLNYKKAPYFHLLYPKIEMLFKKDSFLLAEMCYEHLVFWLSELGVEKKIIRTSQLAVNSKKSNLILDLCKDLDANCYLSGKLGENYLNEEKFHNSGIKIRYQEYRHPVYPQLWGDFIPNLGVLDFVMNTDKYELIMQ